MRAARIAWLWLTALTGCTGASPVGDAAASDTRIGPDGDAARDLDALDAAPEAAYDAAPTDVALTAQKLVWAHNIPVFTLDLASLYVTQYGASYPLDLGDGRPQPEGSVRDALRAGVDGFAVDTLPTLDAVRPFLAAADTVNAADGSRFLVAPTFDLGADTRYAADPHQGFLDYVAAYCAAAAGHPSAARVDGRLVVFTYTTLDAAAWAAVRDHVACPVYWVGNLPFDYVNGSPTSAQLSALTQAAIANYGFDAYYGFSDIAVASGRWAAIAAPLAAAHVPFLGGMFPGYYRGVGVAWPYGPFDQHVDMAATQHYRDGWQNVLDAHPAWTHVATWNDFVEHTTLDPDADLGTIRRDLTAWYAARFKGTPFTLATTPRLYVTTPQALYLTQAGVAEALVINPTHAALTVRLEVLRSDGSTYAMATAAIAADSVGAATLPLAFTASPTGGYVRARATLDALTVLGAPVLVYPANLPDPSTPAGVHSSPQYYALEASAALPAGPTLTLASGGLHVTAAPGSTPRFIDVLCDTNRAGALSTTVTTDYAVSALAPGPAGNTDDNYFERHYGTSFGLCVAREIDRADRVGYSAPVLVAALQRSM